MKIAVFGLGYVGTVSAAVLAGDGHEVVGVDIHDAKVGLTNDGQAPVLEPGLEDLIGASVRSKHLRATTNAGDGIAGAELSFVCVGTPSCRNGSLDLSAVRQVSHDIGSNLHRAATGHTVVVRSTMLPGSMRSDVIPVLEETSGGICGQAFGACYNPEFLREGTALADFRAPPKTVIGSDDASSSARVAELYSTIDAPLFETSIEVAEMAKYIDNAWHAVKVTFANEVGSLANDLGVRTFEAIDIFTQDTKLNISQAYLRPGFAFGGSCLPKDLRALTHMARARDIDLPLLNSVLPSNETHIARALELIKRQGTRKIGCLGLSFKAGTDDLRESPAVEIVERLIGKGFDVRIYDPTVATSKLLGKNLDFITQHIPHLDERMVSDPEALADHADVVVIANQNPEFVEIVASLPETTTVVDLVGLCASGNARPPAAQYYGLCW